MPSLTLTLDASTLAEITRLAGLARPAPLSPERMGAVLVCDALLQMALREGRKAEAGARERKDTGESARGVGMNPNWNDKTNIGDKYGPAMNITDQAEADRYFEDCVEHSMSFGTTREEAERIERANLGYFAGYFDDETRARVERLFHCAHPVFGAIAERGAPTVKEAFKAGLKLGESARAEPA